LEKVQYTGRSSIEKKYPASRKKNPPRKSVKVVKRCHEPKVLHADAGLTRQEKENPEKKRSVFKEDTHPMPDDRVSAGQGA